MRATRLLALATSSLLAANFQCRSAGEAPCPDQEIAGVSVQFYPCIPDRSGQEAKLFVINSQQEFGDAFICSSYRPRPAVFSDSTLLVGWKNYCCCGHVKSQSLRYDCAANTYTYKVEIEQGVCAAAFPVVSQLRVPKLPAGAKVVIDMQ
ncbi:hypothetical protein HHL22_12490 [Hymenobacter sp. RP-2-7]|uniref:Rieske domain-containing protein n=1 Tax=Hymenobacter polaris TaxID=2682546 RepID=A0A7Y0AER9_9BACT|nr:hypothetical protein [Hymenobacter polaris]NML66023.1 hypothetical protein [Hymenobacter polaris]